MASSVFVVLLVVLQLRLYCAQQDAFKVPMLSDLSYQEKNKVKFYCEGRKLDRERLNKGDIAYLTNTSPFRQGPFQEVAEWVVENYPKLQPKAFKTRIGNFLLADFHARREMMVIMKKFMTKEDQPIMDRLLREYPAILTNCVENISKFFKKSDASKSTQRRAEDRAVSKRFHQLMAAFETKECPKAVLL